VTRGLIVEGVGFGNEKVEVRRFDNKFLKKENVIEASSIPSTSVFIPAKIL